MAPRIFPRRHTETPLHRQRGVTASAQKFKLGDRVEAERLRKYRQAWQSEALAYADAIGEIRYPLHFMANQTTRIRLYPAIIEDPDTPPVPLHEAEGVPDDLIQAAQIDLDILGTGQIGLRPILSGLYLNSKTTGEMWLVGRDDPDTGAELWEIRSLDEVHIDDRGGVWLRDSPTQTGTSGVDAMVPFTGSYITRIWRPHPRWRALADSPMRSVLDSCEELLLASRVVRSLLRNRLAGNGLFVLAQELSLPNIDPANEDPQADPVFEALTQAALTPIQDESSASGVLPVFLRAPAETIKDKSAAAHITFDREIDKLLLEVRPELIGRIATGLDWPRELVTGIADLTHWNAWAVDENTFKGHIEPDVIVQCDELTVAYARPFLQARVDSGQAAWDPDLIRRVVYWYDATELVTKPDLTDNANQAFGAGAIGREALRRYTGFGDDDRPDQLDEVLYTLPHLRGVDPHIAIPILAKVAPEITWPDPATIGTPDATAIQAPERQGAPPADVTPGPAPAPQSGPAADEGPPPVPDEHPARDATSGPPARAASGFTATAAQNTGAMVALYPRAEQAAAMALDGGEDPASIHVTLAYLGTAADLTSDQTAALEQIVATVAGQWPPLEGEFGGIARFTADSPDGDPVVATVDVPALASMRDALCQHLAAAGVPLPSDHGFTPHATLAYVEADAPMPVDRMDPVPASFTAISVVLAGQRSDYDLTGVAEPLVAAGRRDTERLSRRLLDIDRTLRAKLLTACDAAVRRELDRAGAKLRSKMNGDKALRASVADVPQSLVAATIGPQRVAGLGVDDSDLTGTDWSDLRLLWEALVAKAQAQARRAAARLADVPESDPAVDVMAVEHDAGRTAGWEALAAGLSALLTARLYNPHPDAPPAGEFDPDVTVPVGLVRRAVEIAGGRAALDVTLPAGAWGIGQGGAVQRFLAANSMSKQSYQWVHGDTARPLPAHEDLDGYEFTSWADDRLVNQDSFPEVNVLAPGDHDGCSCDAWITWQSQAEGVPVAASGGV